MGLCNVPYEEGDDYSQLWREKEVRTRVDHECIDCQVTIPIGEKAGCATSLYDASWHTLYRCGSCLVLAEMVATLSGYCPLWGGLDESVSNLRYEGHELPSPRDFRLRWERIPESEV